VYRDERNPTLWCSIGILYYKIGQYKEALDAYSKAIRFNPYMSAVWYNLGTLYESCKQPPDAKVLSLSTPPPSLSLSLSLSLSRLNSALTEPEKCLNRV
jgi:tetratricopeptide (TPR) repeat protein